MEEKKLTDEEVIEALECCSKSWDCNNCKYDKENNNRFICSENLLKDCLDLIRRLQAENERLTSLWDGKSGFMTSSIGDLPLTVEGLRKAVDEISRLLIVQAELQELNAKYYNEAKDLRRKLNNDGAIYSRLEVDGFIDKARKETAEKFAKKLKQVGELHYYFGEQRYDIATDDIDEICKEITEG